LVKHARLCLFLDYGIRSIYPLKTGAANPHVRARGQSDDCTQAGGVIYSLPGHDLDAIGAYCKARGAQGQAK